LTRGFQRRSLVWLRSSRAFWKGGDRRGLDLENALVVGSIPI